MNKKTGNILMIIGLLFILAALCLIFYNRMDSARAGREAETIVQELEEEMPSPVPVSNPNYLDQHQSMPVNNVNGYDYIGTIAVPALGIDLPVMSEWDYARLKIAPCRYAGSYYNDDMVLCAHNYDSHFGKLRTVEPGTEVIFTNVNGEIFTYTVDNVETLQPTEIQRMIEKEEGEWDLTLYTCHLGGKTRCAVRCVRVTGS